MKSITIRGLDDVLDRRIREKARNQGLSINKTIKNLLKTALGINHAKPQAKQDDFLDIFGAWSEDDLSEFNRASSDFSKIDPGDWN